MSWIKSIDYLQADGRLKQLYDRVRHPEYGIDNILKVHSLRPHTLLGHMTLYKNVLHHRENVLPKWYLEAVGVYVSILNGCEYCIEHHSHGLQRLLADDPAYLRIRQALTQEQFSTVFTPAFVTGLVYAKRLTIAPAEDLSALIQTLRTQGFDDGMILELNQVVAYFNYANRTTNGLGVTTVGDELGLSPGDDEDPDNWNHQ